MCSLACGHLYGRCCIEEELRHRLHDPHGSLQCLICRARALPKHIRLLYATGEVEGEAGGDARRRADVSSEVEREEQQARIADLRRREAEAAVAQLRAQCKALEEQLASRA